MKFASSPMFILAVIMATLVLAFGTAEREQAVSETKTFWRAKLKEQKALAESLAGHQHHLGEVSRVEPAAPQARTGAQVPPARLKRVPAVLPGRVIEGEALAPTAFASAGPVDVQPMQGFGGQWSGGAQLFWRPPAPVDEPIRNWPNLRLRFELQAEQTCELTLVYTVAPDYGKFRVFLDGKIVADVDGWAPQVDVRERALGEQSLDGGWHQMILTVFDRHPSSKGWNVGVDALRLTTAGQGASGAQKPRPQLQEAPAAFVPLGLAAPKPDQRLLDEVARIATATTLPDSLTDEERRVLGRIASDLERGDTERAVATWERLLPGVSSRIDPQVDIAALIQWVLRQSYLESNENLAHHGQKVRFFNQQKRAIREHLAKTREALASLPRNGTAEVETIAVAAQYAKGAQPVRRGPIESMSEQQLTASIAHWEERFQQAGDDAQLANIDLQNELQKEARAFQTLSNALKILHDTAKASIRNLR